MRRTIVWLLLAVLAAVGGGGKAFAAEPLPSWRDGPEAILAFVRDATTEGSPAFVPPAERIATFDNDGTLWAEQPVVQLQFVFNDAAVLAKRDQQIASRPEVKALLEHDKSFFAGKDGEKHLMELMALTSTGMSPDKFADAVRQFFARAKHPVYGIGYERIVYQPMLELLSFLRDKGFEPGSAAAAERISCGSFRRSYTESGLSG